jgi:hypothetical protein
MRRQRHTFYDLDFGIGSPWDYYVYGPRSARAYAEVQELRHEILVTRDECKTTLSDLIRVLRYSGWVYCKDTTEVINRVLRLLYPELWEAAYPYRKLARLGYQIMEAAADADTDEYYNAYDRGERPPWEAAYSPRKAFEKFGAVA